MLYNFNERGAINMTKKAKALAAVEALKKKYPDSFCSLEYKNPLQLLIATRLSAQCTDARVNLVTPELFAKYKTAEDFAGADVADIERIIHSCGFFRAKAKDIKGMCEIIYEKYDSRVPDTLEELTALPGVGRKTANLIMGDVYGMPGAVVADTHLIRITNLLGLVSTKDPKKVELELRKLLPPEESNNFCHRCVFFGREVCISGRPKCDICELKTICSHRVKNGQNSE